jgi:hypothetical protein
LGNVFVASLPHKVLLQSNFKLLLLPSRHKSVAMHTASETEVGVGVSIMGLGTLCLTLGEFLMKKTLIALAAVAAVSTSFAQVSITGFADFTFAKGASRFDNGSAAKGLYNTDAGIDVVATDDLGGGAKATAAMQFNVDGNFQHGAYSGDKSLTLSNSAGSLTLVNTRGGGVLNATMLAPVVAPTDHWSDSANAVMSRSPVDAAVVKMALSPAANVWYKYVESAGLPATDTAAGGANPNRLVVNADGSGQVTPEAVAHVIGGNYTVGAFTVTAEYQSATYSAAATAFQATLGVTDARTTQLDLNAIYDAGFAKFALGYESAKAGTQSTASTGTSASAMTFGVVAPLASNVKIGLNYAKRDAASLYELGAQYDLSKRTYIAASYGAFTNVVAAGLANAGGTWTTDSFGLRVGTTF